MWVQEKGEALYWNKNENALILSVGISFAICQTFPTAKYKVNWLIFVELFEDGKPYISAKYY